MEEPISDSYVPKQFIGSQFQVVDHIIAGDEGIATGLFNDARKKLLEVNQWNLLCGFLSTAFQLADFQGDEVDRSPTIGDYIRVAIPGPSISLERGPDWVRIERLTQINLDEHQQVFFMQVRPSSHPGMPGHDTAHLLKEMATTSFMIVRELRQVTAAIYGRNEIPDIGTDNPTDNTRNQILSKSGAIGMTQPQWKTMVASLLLSETCG